MEISEMLPAHWAAVKTIYEEGIATGNATFQTTAPGWSEWDAAHLPAARLVAVENDTVLGWAALTPVSGRCVYAGVAEVSVYVSTAARGRGLGKQLLAALVTASEAAGLWTLQAGIFPENTASIKIHEACGFRIVGIRERIGKMTGHEGMKGNNVWRDNLFLERRSTITGTD
jgi:L-amino acid N-acyltransferase YncA